MNDSYRPKCGINHIYPKYFFPDVKITVFNGLKFITAVLKIIGLIYVPSCKEELFVKPRGHPIISPFGAVCGLS